MDRYLYAASSLFITHFSKNYKIKPRPSIRHRESVSRKTNFRRTRIELFSLGSFHVPIFCLFRIFVFRRRFPVFHFSSLPSGEGV